MYVQGIYPKCACLATNAGERGEGIVEKGGKRERDRRERKERKRRKEEED